MRTSRFTEEQIRYAVQQAEAGLGVPELCRKYGVAPAPFYRWRQKYGALTKSELVRLVRDVEVRSEVVSLRRELADVSRQEARLLDAYVDETLQVPALRDRLAVLGQQRAGLEARVAEGEARVRAQDAENARQAAVERFCQSV